MEYFNKLELTQQHLKDNIKNVKDITITENAVDIIFKDESRIHFCADVTDIILNIPVPELTCCPNRIYCEKCEWEDEKED